MELFKRAYAPRYYHNNNNNNKVQAWIKTVATTKSQLQKLLILTWI